MIKDNHIYILTTVQDIKEGKMFPSYRSVGWFHTLEDAEECVINNHGDIWEHDYYQWAVIEKTCPGLYPISPIDIKDKETWFKLSTSENGFKATKINKPEQFKQMCNFGLG